MALTTHRVTVATEAPVDEVQTVTVTATGGTWTIAYPGGDPSSALDFDATSAEVQAALIALDEFASGDVVVTGDGPHTITFGNDYAGTDVPLLEVDDTNATGGTVTIEETTPGSPRTPTRVDSTTQGEAQHGSEILLTNVAGGDTIYLGGSDVTTDTGYILGAGSSLPNMLELRVDDALYAVTADGDSAVVQVIEVGL